MTNSEKIKNLAKTIIYYSINVKPGDRIQIRFKDIECKELVMELCKEIQLIGALAIPKYDDVEINSLLRHTYRDGVIDSLAEIITNEADTYDAYISIQYNNAHASSLERSESYNGLLKKLSEYNKKVRSKKSVVVYYPSAIDAKKHSMSEKEYNDFVFSILNFDYSRLDDPMKRLKSLLDKTDKVTLLGEKTELSFSIEGIDSVILDGKINIPDGEIYTSPIVSSVNGYITFNIPSYYMGSYFDNIYLRFVNGLVEDFSCNNPEAFEKIINIDGGSRSIGEFGIGVNPFVNTPVLNTLFDEKMYGSYHLALGQSYRNAYNGNDSNNHWDLIKSDLKEHGGGQIYFDNNLIRENGEFIPPELIELNKELILKRK